MSPETELVLCACRLPVSPRADERIAQLLKEPLEWDIVLARAFAWQVEPVAFENLRVRYSGFIPEATLSILRAREAEARANSLGQTLVMMELLRSFGAAGLRVIVLKGPAIGVLAYGDPSLRSFGDIDLLVRSEDLKAARMVLFKAAFIETGPPGFQARFFTELNHVCFSDRKSKVELHYSLFQRKLNAHFDEDDVWQRIRTVPCLKGSIDVLAPWDLVLFLCAHGAKHEWEVFRWVCDIAQLVDRLSESEIARLAALAREYHLTRVLGLGVQLIENTFGRHGMPPERLRDLTDRHTGRLAAIVERRWESGETEREGRGSLARIHPYLFWASSRERRRDQLVSLARFLFLPTEVDRGPRVLATLLRPPRLLANTVKRLASRQN